MFIKVSSSTWDSKTLAPRAVATYRRQLPYVLEAEHGIWKFCLQELQKFRAVTTDNLTS